MALLGWLLILTVVVALLIVPVSLGAIYVLEQPWVLLAMMCLGGGMVYAGFKKSRE